MSEADMEGAGLRRSEARQQESRAGEEENGARRGVEGKSRGRDGQAAEENAQEKRAGLGLGEKGKKGGLYTIYPTAQDALP